MDIYTNTRSRKDHMRNALVRLADPPCAIGAAVAFFTDPEPVQFWSRQGCFPIRLIVRLGFPTDPAALDAILKLEGVQVRFFTGRLFHPKLYVFYERCAVVGSSNLTRAALWDNREVNVAVPRGSRAFDDLVATFEDYWRLAPPLAPATLSAYAAVWQRHRSKMDWEDDFIADVERRVGKHEINEVRVGGSKPTKNDIELGAYRRQYSDILTAFQLVRRLYEARGVRRMAGSKVPLRLEIDQFFSYLREGPGKGEAWRDRPYLSGAALEQSINVALDDWFKTDWSYFQHLESGPRSWHVIESVLGNRAKLASASYDEILEALSCCHSFHERKRHFHGGHDTHLAEFKSRNDVAAVRRTLDYLIRGDEPFIDRMGRCIFDPDWRLPHLGRSAIQEAFGWVNREEAPICNSRTLKGLRWLGFRVGVDEDD